MEEIARYEQEVAALKCGDPARPPLLHNLACRLRERFLVGGDPGDLRAAIGRSEAAVAESPPGDPNLPVYENTLGNSVGDRYELSHEPGDLDRAIALQQRAVAACAPEDRPEFSANLAESLRDRYLRDGRREDLDDAIARLEASLDEAREAARPGLTCNLSGALQSRYARTGSLDDLERAVTAARRAVEDADDPVFFNALGGALLSRFAREARPADLDEAVERLEAGLASCPPGSPRRATLLANLGAALAARATSTDLERAVDLHAAGAREATGRADEALHLDDLAAALLDRHQRTGRRRDLRRAIHAWQRAVAETPAGDPRRARRLANLARGLSVRSRPLDAVRARALYRESCRAALESDPEAALAAAVEWGRWSRRAEAYEYGLDALDRLTRVQLRRRGKEAWVRSAAGVAVGGAFAHVSDGDPARATLALERGRALVFSEALERDRADLSRLPYAGLAAQFHAARDRLVVCLLVSEWG